MIVLNHISISQGFIARVCNHILCHASPPTMFKQSTLGKLVKSMPSTIILGKDVYEDMAIDVDIKL